MIYAELYRTASVEAEWDKNEACRQALAAADRADAADQAATEWIVRKVTESENENLLRGWARNSDLRIVAAVAENEDTPDDAVRELATHRTAKIRRIIAGRYNAPNDVFTLLAGDSSKTVRAAVPTAMKQPLGEVPDLATARVAYETATYGTAEWDVAAAQYARTPEGHEAVWSELQRTAPIEAEWDKNESCRRAMWVARRYGFVDHDLYR